MIHAEHLVASLGLFGRLFHEGVLVTTGVEVGEQLGVDELLGLPERKQKTKVINLDSCAMVPFGG